MTTLSHIAAMSIYYGTTAMPPSRRAGKRVKRGRSQFGEAKSCSIQESAPPALVVGRSVEVVLNPLPLRLLHVAPRLEDLRQLTIFGERLTVPGVADFRPFSQGDERAIAADLLDG